MDLAIDIVLKLLAISVAFVVVDQLMNFGWKILLPLALLSIFITATVIFLFPNL